MYLLMQAMINIFLIFVKSSLKIILFGGEEILLNLLPRQKIIGRVLKWQQFVATPQNSPQKER